MTTCTCSYLSALFSTLNPILSVTNLSRLEYAETQCTRKPRAYEYATRAVTQGPIRFFHDLSAKRKDNHNTIVPALLGIEPNIN